MGSGQVMSELDLVLATQSPILPASPPPTREEGIGNLSSSNPCWRLTKWPQGVGEGREGTC